MGFSRVLPCKADSTVAEVGHGWNGITPKMEWKSCPAGAVQTGAGYKDFGIQVSRKKRQLP